MRPLTIGLAAAGVVAAGVTALAIGASRRDDAPTPGTVGTVSWSENRHRDVVLGTRVVETHASLGDAKRAAERLGEAPTDYARTMGGFGHPIAVVRDDANDRYALRYLEMVDGDDTIPLPAPSGVNGIGALTITDPDVVAYMDGTFMYDTAELRSRESS